MDFAALTQRIKGWGRELGCEEAWLGTETDNEPAKALYRRYKPEEDEVIQYFLFRL